MNIRLNKILLHNPNLYVVLFWGMLLFSSCLKNPTQPLDNPNDPNNQEFKPSVTTNRGYNLIVEEGKLIGVKVLWNKNDSFYDSLSITKIYKENILFKKWITDTLEYYNDFDYQPNINSYTYILNKIKNGKLSENDSIHVDINSSSEFLSVELDKSGYFSTPKVKLTWSLPEFTVDSIHVNRIIFGKIDTVFTFYDRAIELIDLGSFETHVNTYEVITYFENFYQKKSIDYTFSYPKLQTPIYTVGGGLEIDFRTPYDKRKNYIIYSFYDKDGISPPLLDTIDVVNKVIADIPNVYFNYSLKLYLVDNGVIIDSLFTEKTII